MSLYNITNITQETNKFTVFIWLVWCKMVQNNVHFEIKVMFMCVIQVSVRTRLAYEIERLFATERI